jgi:hypothetical protein
MYSPKISSELVVRLYPIAKQKHIPMTTLVNQILNTAVTQIEKNTNLDRPLTVHEVQNPINSEYGSNSIG